MQIYRNAKITYRNQLNINEIRYLESFKNGSLLWHKKVLGILFYWNPVIWRILFLNVIFSSKGRFYLILPSTEVLKGIYAQNGILFFPANH